MTEEEGQRGVHSLQLRRNISPLLAPPLLAPPLWWKLPPLLAPPLLAPPLLAGQD